MHVRAGDGMPDIVRRERVAFQNLGGIDGTGRTRKAQGSLAVVRNLKRAHVEHCAVTGQADGAHAACAVCAQRDKGEPVPDIKGGHGRIVLRCAQAFQVQVRIGKRIRIREHADLGFGFRLQAPGQGKRGIQIGGTVLCAQSVQNPACLHPVRGPGKRAERGQGLRDDRDLGAGVHTVQELQGMCAGEVQAASAVLPRLHAGRQVKHEDHVGGFSGVHHGMHETENEHGRGEQLKRQEQMPAQLLQGTLSLLLGKRALPQKRGGNRMIIVPRPEQVQNDNDRQAQKQPGKARGQK